MPTASTPRMTGRPWRRLRARILSESDVCHICGHHGSDAVDHVIPLYRGGTNDPTNLRPAHHTSECPTCGRKCNREKSSNEFAPIIRDSGALRLPRTR